jgi:hypothetical protein
MSLKSCIKELGGFMDKLVRSVLEIPDIAPVAKVTKSVTKKREELRPAFQQEQAMVVDKELRLLWRYDRKVQQELNDCVDDSSPASSSGLIDFEFDKLAMDAARATSLLKMLTEEKRWRMDLSKAGWASKERKEKSKRCLLPFYWQ